ncbi:hypothetical protein [Modicisalibacter sp. 'Wilcox']|uniref:hypothetical protein n=1 Tax=Modicisalibacter sp. 'Wilcox' TaxID=2679914 RepID=UPI0013D44A7D|nr:hypothetical protein [Modicisalibacter sp. 'Wilcox']
MSRVAARERRENDTSARIPLKLELALELLLQADDAQRYITTLDALQAYGDTCWHSTVAALRAKGVEFLQERYQHAHRHGGHARFEAYRLSPDSREQAEQLLRWYQALPGQGVRHAG